MAHMNIPGPSSAQPTGNFLDDIWESVAIITDASWSSKVSVAVSTQCYYEIPYHIQFVPYPQGGDSVATKTITVALIKSGKGGITIFGIAETPFSEICKKLQTVANVSGANYQIRGYPKMTKFFHDKFPDVLLFKRIDLSVPEVVADTSDDDLFEVGLTHGHSRALVLKYYTLYPNACGLGVNVTTQLTPEIKRDIGNLYFNSLLALVPPHIHDAIIEKLKPIAMKGAIRISQMTLNEFAPYRETRAPPERLMFCALVSATCFTKHGVQAQHLTDWCKNRTNAMFAKAGKQPIAVPPEFQYEAPVLAEFLVDRLDLRAAFLEPILSIPRVEIKLPALYSAVQSQISLITQYYAMSTLRIAYAFMDLCETEAHTLKPVLTQGTALMKHYEDLLEDQKGRSIAFHHYCVIYDRPSWMEASSYPDVAYCAHLKQQSLGDKSWANYRSSSVATTIDKATLGAKTAIPLESTSIMQGSLDPMVADFLTARGKTCSANPTPNALVLAAMNRP